MATSILAPNWHLRAARIRFAVSPMACHRSILTRVAKPLDHPACSASSVSLRPGGVLPPREVGEGRALVHVKVLLAALVGGMGGHTLAGECHQIADVHHRVNLNC